jgi:predicted GIY-YIG superfamily endonuclease
MFFVYITARGKNGTLYTGHCEELEIRIQQHKEKRLGGFTAKYGVDQLVCSKCIRLATRRSGGSGRSRSGSVCGSCS